VDKIVISCVDVEMKTDISEQNLAISFLKGVLITPGYLLKNPCYNP
jgi:hypothetical protein